MACSIVVKVVCLALMCLVSGTTVLTNATLTCEEVNNSLIPCIPYISGGVDSPPQPCCDGIKNLISEATSKEDRQAVCECIKAGLKNLPGYLLGKVQSLPKKCGVSLPFEISPSIDCTK